MSHRKISISRQTGFWFSSMVLLALVALRVMTPAQDTRQNTQLTRQLGSPDTASGKAFVAEAYGKLPLAFEANQGQTDDSVEFISRGSGYTLFLTANEAVLSLRQPTEPSSAGFQPAPRAAKMAALRPKTESPQASAVVRMKLVGANSTPAVTGEDQLPGKSNYFIGNDPEQWRTHVPNYTKVKYREVYPGVDLIYYGNQRQLEYDFVVSPGADPGVIRLRFQGADELTFG